MDRRIVIEAFFGRARLVIVFWLFGVIGLELVTLAGKWLANVGASADAKALGFVVAVSAFVFSYIYILWALISVWRCAPNARSRWWGYLARGSVVAYGIYAAWTAYQAATWFNETFT